MENCSQRELFDCCCTFLFFHSVVQIFRTLVLASLSHFTDRVISFVIMMLKFANENYTPKAHRNAIKNSAWLLTQRQLNTKHLVDECVCNINTLEAIELNSIVTIIFTYFTCMLVWFGEHYSNFVNVTTYH